MRVCCQCGKEVVFRQNAFKAEVNGWIHLHEGEIYLLGYICTWQTHILKIDDTMEERDYKIHQVTEALDNR